ncbi:MAG TPA: mechanosensitive ion channel family protein [Phaeodactylibacter sp.]|nr:mechanosensitive ion channel family protein [Phaeodactylibacter sp.]
MEQINASLGRIWETLEGWVDSFMSNLPNLMLAVIVLALSIFLSRYVKKYFSKVVYRISSNHTVNSLLVNIATAAFLIVMLFVVLGILGLDTALTSLLAGAGVVGLAIGLAVQEPLMNVFSGILMSTKRLYNVGDLIESNGYYGVIQQVNLRSTIIKQMSGEEVLLPNKMIIQNPLTNYTVSKERRLDFSCGISYGDDLEKVKRITTEAIEQEVDYDKKRPVDFFYNEFGNSSINFIVRIWLKQTTQKNLLATQSQVVMAMKKAFDKNDITIPFPIRTLDFGIKGGEKLNEVMPQALSNGEREV